MQTIKGGEKVKKIKLIALMLVVILTFGSSVALAESVYSMTWGTSPNPATYTGNQWSGTAGGWFGISERKVCFSSRG